MLHLCTAMFEQEVQTSHMGAGGGELVAVAYEFGMYIGASRTT